MGSPVGAYKAGYRMLLAGKLASASSGMVAADTRARASMFMTWKLAKNGCICASEQKGNACTLGLHLVKSKLAQRFTTNCHKAKLCAHDLGRGSIE